MKGLLEEAVFTYTITPYQEAGWWAQSVDCKGLGFYVNATKGTKVQYLQESSREILILGLCVDAYGEYSQEEIPSLLLRKNWKNIVELYRFCDRLAGRFLLAAAIGGRRFLFGDATTSIPIHYGYDEDAGFYASPFDRMTAAYLHLAPDKKLSKIRKSQAPVQPMPGDLTPYREVRCLLPNHILDLDKGQVRRVASKVGKLKKKEILDQSILMCQNIFLEYEKSYHLICPLTSGYDSRVVLAVANSCGKQIPCFTWQQEGFTSQTDDLRIPGEICARTGNPYSILSQTELPPAYFQEIDSLGGLVNAYETVEEAYTFQSRYEDYARINGNIIGQIGKSSVMNAVPSFLASPSFLQCKLHNTHKDCQKALKTYRKGLRKAGEEICDLAAWELRCGRWAGQEEALYALCGMKSLCIFNCRALIQLWMGIPRKERVKNALHIGMIQRLSQPLLDHPFNPDAKTGILKSHWFLFYLTTYGKQALLLWKRRKNKLIDKEGKSYA